MDRKTFAIGILAVTAVLLFIAQFMPVRTAMADDSVSDRNYSIVTGHGSQGGESLYIFNRGTGVMAVFTWDANDRRVKLRARRSIEEAIMQ